MTGKQPRWVVVAAAASLFAGCVTGAQAESDPTDSVDLVITGGTIYSGAEGELPIVGDVAIRGDRIVHVGTRRAFKAARVIDARGMIVAPGFIDAHAHPDTYIRSPDAVQRLNAPWLMQGVSTVVIGVDGAGTPDIKADTGALIAARIGTNIVPFVGFGAVRSRVLGKDSRAPTAEELDRMKGLVVQAMCEGAAGLSTGLFYAPQSFAETGEVIALAREAGRLGGIYDTHQRDESSYSIGLLASVMEALRIGREASIPVHFAHLKALGVDVQGLAPQVIALIAKARRQGIDVTADQYPWLASGTSLEAALIPHWAVDGGRDALLHRLDNPALLTRIRTEMRDNLRRRGGPAALLLTSPGGPLTGKTLEQVAHDWGDVEPIDAALRIVRTRFAEGDAAQGTGVASFNMSEDDVEAIMQQPWVVTGSDGSDGHPRQFATFPTKYAVYVRQEHVIDLASFIRRSTGLTADIYRLEKRGYLRKGHFADVLVFDPATYGPRADYAHPDVLSSGVRLLLVNGATAVDAEQLTGAAAGRALLRAPCTGRQSERHAGFTASGAPRVLPSAPSRTRSRRRSHRCARGRRAGAPVSSGGSPARTWPP